MSLLDNLDNINDSDSENDEDYVPTGSPPPSKKRKLLNEAQPEVPETQVQPSPIPEALTTTDKPETSPFSFNGFVLDKVLNENPSSKMISLLGKLSQDPDNKPLITLLEKTPFVSSEMPELVKSTSLETLFENDIYKTYKGFFQERVDNVKVTVIYPATEKHIEKYTRKPLHMVVETPAVYAVTTQPFIQSSANTFSLQWVYNILEHQSEADRIVLEDPDPNVGFLLLPDMKWNQSQLEDLYLMAIVLRRDLRSLRDLTAEHLPLLKNIRDKATVAIVAKYGIPSSKLRTYLHYLPSYYHLHVHFTALTFDAPGSGCERAHLLDSVISNLEISPAYYQDCTLNFLVKEGDPLHLKIIGSQDNSQKP